ncbi:MAG TPA: hypothetical protein VGI40_27280 [Pirellulaceae bacterium]|jgi:hypothetical protein
MKSLTTTSALLWVIATTSTVSTLFAADPSLEVRQITHGPLHHFFGYIGHVQNIPWNKSGRYIVCLQTPVRDHLPDGSEPAEVVLLDTQNDYQPRVVAQCRAWNPQQGTMLYWNPLAQETQFFFNDRAPLTNKVFCVLFDISRGTSGERVREYRFDDSPVGNGGIAQRGGKFLAINYGRMARLRRVTGYAGAYDGTGDVLHPADDGVFVVDVATSERKLLISFQKLAAVLRSIAPAIDTQALFINHTLWSRDDSRIYFYVRGGWDLGGTQVNVPVVMNADGTNLRPLKDFIGGHPEWLDGQRLIGTLNNEQIIYDCEAMKVVGKFGDKGIFPKPGDDIALSPSGEWFVNGYRIGNQNFYAFLRLKDGANVTSQPFDVRGWTQGDLRVDPSPNWNRQNNQILVSALADDAEKTRQLFLITVR